jgi:hypothetical protein
VYVGPWQYGYGQLPVDYSINGWFNSLSEWTSAEDALMTNTNHGCSWTITNFQSPQYPRTQAGIVYEQEQEFTINYATWNGTTCVPAPPLIGNKNANIYVQ